MNNSQINKELKRLEFEFHLASNDLSILEWRKIRTSEYWLSDKMNKLDSLKHKIRIIEKYKSIVRPR